MTEAEQNGLWVSGVHLEKLFTFKVSLNSIMLHSIILIQVGIALKH